ncbi:MAG: pyruvate kinase [bacterium]|nr:pyruvate kinase [bacterium]
MTKRTKIVCTIGPASESKAMLTRLVRAGMNVCRLNFSHGEYAWHAKAIKTIRAVAKATGEPIAILQDLQGPKIRVGNLPKEGVVFRQGKSITLTTAATVYRGGKIPLTYRSLHSDVKAGHRILFDDGLLEVRVTKVHGRDISCQVITGGILTSHKGMNLPNTVIDIPALTAKDRKDVAFGVQNGVDWIALSFVKHARDVELLRALIAKLGGKQKIIAKIEKHEAISNFSSILHAVDGIMVARGDLGVEIPAAEVPLRQKEIIERCRAVGKPVVVATQMLDSMIRNPRPTRAEVSDVANAIIDHTDAIMLSGESATGKYPVQAVQMMTKIATETEASHLDDVAPTMPPPKIWGLPDVVAEVSSVLAAHAQDASGILVATLTGATARRISRFHPELQIFAATPDPLVARQLSLSYAVRSIVVSMTEDRNAFVHQCLRILRQRRLLPRRGALIIVAGEPWGKVGTANAVEVRKL